MNGLIDTSDGIKIYDEDGEEIISWTFKEVEANVEVVVSIVQAVSIVCLEGANKLKEVLDN